MEPIQRPSYASESHVAESEARLSLRTERPGVTAPTSKCLSGNAGGIKSTMRYVAVFDGGVARNGPSDP
jgi:hypothetical protein